MRRNRRKFDFYVALARRFKTSEIGALIAQYAATFATYRHTGLFASDDLDEFLIAMSRSKALPEIAKNQQAQTSILHIMSRPFETGGHTRVVERWIEASRADEKHSLLITRGAKPTKKLIEQVNLHGGTIITLSPWTPLIRRAIEIRKIASHFSSIVLHVHMDDILPLIALGQNPLNLPVYHFNHADHRFWVGAKLPMQVLEMRRWGSQLSEIHRGITNRKIVGIPFPKHNEKPSRALRQEVRLKLGIQENSKVLLTVASSKKLVAGPKTNFPREVASLLAGDPERELIVVGAKQSDNQEWKTLCKSFPDRVTLLPQMSRSKVREYLLASDLGLDSFPMSGGTVVLEMLAAGLPFVSLACETGHFDAISSSIFYCADTNSWVAKADQFLSMDEKPLQELIALELESIKAKYGEQIWASILAEASSSDNLATSPNTGAQPDIDQLNAYLIQSTPYKAKFLL